MHQEAVARERGRPVENRHVGIALTGPDIDVSAVARGFGATTYGRLASPAELAEAVADALDVLGRGGVAVLDVEAAKG